MINSLSDYFDLLFKTCFHNAIPLPFSLRHNKKEKEDDSKPPRASRHPLSISSAFFF